MLAILSELSLCLVLASALGLWIGILTAQESCAKYSKKAD